MHAGTAGAHSRRDVLWSRSRYEKQKLKSIRQYLNFKFSLIKKKTYAHFDKVLEFGRVRKANIHHFIKMIKHSPSWETTSSIEKRIISREWYPDQENAAY